MTDATLDRRTLIAGGAALAAAAGATLSGLPGSARPVSSAPAGATGLAAWEELVGHVVHLVGDGLRVAAQVIDARDTTPAVDPAATGTSYSILFDLPDLPQPGHHLVTVAEVPGIALTITPVNRDGSWEAVVDTRRPVR